MPSKIEQIHKEFRDQGLAVLAVNIGEERAAVDAWAKDKQVSFTILVDDKGRVSEAYKIIATPTVFVIGRDGRLAGKAIGPKDWSGEKGKAVFRALLGKG